MQEHTIKIGEEDSTGEWSRVCCCGSQIPEFIDNKW